MDLITPRVRSHCIRTAFEGCNRSIRDSLTPEEQNILDKVKSLLEVIKTSDCHVFCMGSYAGFLEGVLKDYNSITIVYTCTKSKWSQILDPLTNLLLFTTDQANIFILKEEIRSLVNDEKLERKKCMLEFRDGTKLVIDIGKVSIFQEDLKQNMYELFSYLRTNINKVALPCAWEVLFRGEKVEEHYMLQNYGSPFSLSWYCARNLQFI